MRQINRLVGVLYGGLFLNWFLWYCLPLWARYPDYTTQIMCYWLAPVALCLLASHWWVRRGEYWAAVLPLLFSVLFYRAPFVIWDCQPRGMPPHPIASPL